MAEAKKPAAKKTAAKTPAKKVAAKKAAPAAKKAAVKATAAKKVATPVAVTPAVTTPAVEAKVEVKTETKAVPVASTKPAAAVPAAADFDLQHMLELGCHFGHKASKWHPQMAPYIYGEKDGVHLFDLPQVAQLLAAACAYVYKLGQEGKTMVVVGTKKAARDVVKEAALAAGCCYINSRWMGGLLTNWSQVSRSIRRMEEIREGLASDKYKGYTKYERVQLDKEQQKLERFFGGLRSLKGKPDCIVVIDPKKEHIAVSEANSMNVPVIALIDSDSDPRPVQLVLPGNDDAQKSIQFFVEQLTAAYQAGRNAKK